MRASLEPSTAGIDEQWWQLLGGDELRDLIKGYLGKLEEDGVEGILQGLGPGNFQDDQGLRGWQRALRYCPRELVDLVNSKACRGAFCGGSVSFVHRTHRSHL